ncbi:MAG TPA: hypothetical protein VNJ53_05335 [Gaiellaceae bacterium]|nr:hypothetical protein [Gaiellaceae bacterium]
MRKLFRRPSPALVVASLALLVALGGTSFAAATQLARNSVGTAQLRAGAVTNPKIRNSAVTSAKVANRSLLRVDFAPGQLPAGPTGPQGPAGPAGPAGPQGPAGVIGAITVRSSSAVINDPTSALDIGKARVTSTCQGNERAISAGTSWGDDDEFQLYTSEIQPQVNSQNQVVGFSAVGLNNTAQSSTFTVHVLCYTP